MKKRKKITEVNSLKEVPVFKTEEQERKYWDTHTLSDKLWDELYDPKVEKEFNSMIKKLKMTDRRK